jgi:hypothetical protein
VLLRKSKNSQNATTATKQVRGKQMKKLLFSLACVIGLGYQACAIPLTIGDAKYLGSINDGIPSNPSDEAGYINNLVTLAAGAGNTVIGTETYNRVGSTLAGPFPAATSTDSVKDESGGTTIDATGFTYVIGKYDAHLAGSLVWMIGPGDGEVTLPDKYNGKGLSHISLYNPTAVVDGGTTIALLGLGLMGLGFVSRRKA